MLRNVIKFLLICFLVGAAITATDKRSTRFTPGGGSSGGAGAGGNWKTVSLGGAVLNLSKNELPHRSRLAGPMGTCWLGSRLV